MDNEVPAPAADVASAMAAVATIDLANVTRKLRQEQGWTEAEAATAVTRYRRFLCMHRLGVEFDLVPTKDIDKVWHQHILHTSDYARDCQRVFGAFMHHFPSEDDSETTRAAARANFAKTQARYAELFGEDYVDTWLTYFLL